MLARLSADSTAVHSVESGVVLRVPLWVGSWAVSSAAVTDVRQAALMVAIRVAVLAGTSAESKAAG